MRNLLKPASRLIAVFIFTMIISGGILTYLSINSISNFRELTEKKVSEEQLSVSYKLSLRFQAFLEEIANDFSAEEWSLVENPFVLDRTGMFLKPWYLEGSKLKDGPATSSAYEQNFRMAQQNEFRERNLEGALRHYRRSLSRASSSSE